MQLALHGWKGGVRGQLMEMQVKEKEWKNTEFREGRSGAGDVKEWRSR